MKAILALLIFGGLAAAAMADSVRVYIGSGKNGVYTAMLDRESGTLSEPVLVGKGGAGFLALVPERKLLFSTCFLPGKPRGKNGGVAAWKIKDDGSLQRINDQPSEGAGPCHVSVDATGNTLLVANYGSGSVAAFKIDEDGSVVKSASAHQHEGSSVIEKRQSGPHAHSFYPGPNNKFAYAPDLGIDKVMIYKLDAANGAVAEAGFAKVPPGSGPRHMKFGNDGKQAYVLNELTLTISVFDVDSATGMFEEKQLVSTFEDGVDKSNMSCSEIRVHPNGKFIYAANRDLDGKNRDSVSVFKVLDGGKLERIQRIGAEVWIPRNIGIDPSGRYLLAAGQRSNEVSIFAIDPASGKLSSTGKKVPLEAAMCIEFLEG